MRRQLVASQTDLDKPVFLFQTSDSPIRFEVVYGLQVDSNLDYLAAATQYGSCVMHSATCCCLI